VLCSQLRELTYADISSKYSVKNIQWNLYPSFPHALLSRKYHSHSLVPVHCPYTYNIPQLLFIFCGPFTSIG
jgi:hypothetical protein